jgi:hypothetical protein
MLVACRATVAKPIRESLDNIDNLSSTQATMKAPVNTTKQGKKHLKTID